MNYIVTTTINSPTEATIKFSQMDGWRLIVVGDLKTPHEEYTKIDCIYLHPSYQDKAYKELSDKIGWNKIQRRNIGFVEAYRLGADLIATVDDDNIPYETWGKEILLGQRKYVAKAQSSGIVIDPIFYTSYKHLWHRGFPIQEIINRKDELIVYNKTETFDIQANFWDGDPDIDAICRIMYKPYCLFKQEHFPFSTDKFSPFNSQNTIIKSYVIPHYFMFPYIGRMDDIWGGYLVEALGCKVIYNDATVIQERNNHKMEKDLEAEVIGYTKTLDLLKALKNDPYSIKEFIPNESWEAYLAYRKCFEEL